MTANYVKFLRGVNKAFNNLPSKDSDTLYFIKDNEDKSFQMYLGSTPIGISSLNDLDDMKISDSLQANDIFIYDGEKWINSSLDTLKPLLEMQGATNDKDGISGLVPTPTKEVKDNFLRGDGKWVDISEKIIEVSFPLISKAVGDLINNAPEAFDTLKEIADWIETDEAGTVSLINQVSILEQNVGKLSESIQTTSDEIQDLKDRVDLLEGGTSKDYLTKSQFETFVGKLDNDNITLNNLKTENKTSLLEAINEIHDQLMWGELNT